MARIRSLVETTKGSILLSPGQQVPTLKGTEVAYHYAYELPQGAVVFIRGARATLENVVATLSLQSEEYRQHRSRIFVPGDSPEVRTVLGQMLREVVRIDFEAEGRQFSTQNDAIAYLHRMTGGKIGEAAVKTWWNGRTLFPADPEILREMHPLLNEWATDEVVESAKELRFIHSGATRGSVSIGERQDEPRKQPSSWIETDEPGRLRKWLIELKKGNVKVEDVLTKAVVKGVSEVDIDNQETKREGQGRAGLLPKDIVGFTARDSAERNETLLRYPGIDRGAQLESALVERKALILGEGAASLIPMSRRILKFMADNGSVYIPDGPNFFYIMKALANPLLGSRAVTIAEQRATYQDMDTMCGMLARGELGPGTRITLNPLERFLHLRILIKQLEQRKTESVIDRAALSAEEYQYFFVNPYLVSIYAKAQQHMNLDPKLRSRTRVKKESLDVGIIRLIFSSAAQDQAVIEFRRKLIRLEREANMPFMIPLIQSILIEPIKDERMLTILDKLKAAYGISSFHSYHPEMEPRAKQLWYATFSQEVLDKAGQRAAEVIARMEAAKRK